MSSELPQNPVDRIADLEREVASLRQLVLVNQRQPQQTTYRQIRWARTVKQTDGSPGDPGTYPGSGYRMPITFLQAGPGSDPQDDPPEFTRRSAKHQNFLYNPAGLLAEGTDVLVFQDDPHHWPIQGATLRYGTAVARGTLAAGSLFANMPLVTQISSGVDGLYGPDVGISIDASDANALHVDVGGLRLASWSVELRAANGTGFGNTVSFRIGVDRDHDDDYGDATAIGNKPGGMNITIPSTGATWTAWASITQLIGSGVDSPGAELLVDDRLKLILVKETGGTFDLHYYSYLTVSSVLI